MELVQKVLGKTVGVDTAIFIYFIEENPHYFQSLKSFFQENKEGNIKIITSTVTLLELLVKPLSLGRDDLVMQYKEIFSKSGNIEMIDLNPGISEISARLRADNGCRTPDAIQAGTAIYGNADFFLTNDKGLKKITEIPVIILDEMTTME